MLVLCEGRCDFQTGLELHIQGGVKAILCCVVTELTHIAHPKRRCFSDRYVKSGFNECCILCDCDTLDGKGIASCEVLRGFRRDVTISVTPAESSLQIGGGGTKLEGADALRPRVVKVVLVVSPLTDKAAAPPFSVKPSVCKRTCERLPNGSKDAAAVSMR